MVSPLSHNFYLCGFWKSLRLLPTRISRHVIYIVLILALGGMYLSLSYKSVFFAEDEGATAYHFEKSLEGEMQHRDFYSVYGAGFYILGENLFRLFGVKLTVLRTFVLALKLVMAILIYLIALYVARPFFSFLGTLGFIVWWGDPFIATPAHFYPSHINHVLGLLSILLVLLYLAHGKKRYVFFAGMVIGLGTLFKPTLAIFNLLALFFFFYSRELLLDLTEESTDSVAGVKTFFGKAGLILELLVCLAGIALLSVVFKQYHLNLSGFFYFLIPLYLLLGFLSVLAFRVLRMSDRTAIIWRNCSETYLLYALSLGGVIFWQLVQIAYFLRKGVLDDFLRTYTSTSYYSNYFFPLWHGLLILTLCFAALLIVGVFQIAMSVKDTSKARKLAVIAAMFCAVSVPLVLWFLFLRLPKGFHIAVWTLILPFSVLAAFLLFVEDLRNKLTSATLPSLLSVLVVTLYAALILLDAFPKADIGHISMILPPFLILLAFLGDRLFSSIQGYLADDFPKHSRLVSGMVTGLLGFGIFLPSLLMMVLFQVAIVPLRDGLHLYRGSFMLVPRYRVPLERAKGLSLHIIDEYYWAPLSDPKVKAFFNTAEYLIQTTRKGDKLFSTMTSSLMLYFLSDRDGVSDKANCYVWQTVEGTTTSSAFEDFSDRKLAQLIHAERPKVVIVEEGSVETKRFIANWPITWDVIMRSYHLTHREGPFLLYAIPK